MPTESLPKTVGRIEGKVDEIASNLIRVTEILLGDGQPGAVERLTRMEDGLSTAVKTVEANAEAVKGLVAEVKNLESLLHEHANDKDKHSWRMFLNGRVLGGIFFGSLLLHTAFEQAGMVSWGDLLNRLMGFFR